MATLTIAGHAFDVADDPRFVPGATIELDEGTASTLQQVRRENLRNNFANKVKTHLPEGGELSPEKLSELQQELNAYAEKYAFGVRATGGGSAKRVSDPVEREARRLAKTAIVQTYEQKHGTTIKGAELNAAVDTLMAAKGEDYMKRARRNLRELEAEANAILHSEHF